METMEHEVWINADPAQVFEALTTRAGLDAWWGRALEAEPRLGSVVEFDHGLGDPMRMEITVLRFRDTGWAPRSRWYGFCNTAWGETLSVNFKNYCESQAATTR